MLTTIEHIKVVRDIANNIRPERLLPYIKEVEDANVMPAIGAALYEKLCDGVDVDPILLDGGYYDAPDCGRDYCHGLHLAVAYLTYARVLRNNRINVTAFGITQKNSSLSQPAGADDVDIAAEDAKKMGDLYLASCVRYLHRNDSCCSQKVGHSVRFGNIQILN